MTASVLEVRLGVLSYEVFGSGLAKTSGLDVWI